MDNEKNYDIKKDERIKIEENYGNYDWGRLHTNQLDILKTEIKIGLEDPFIQYFYVS
jgi:hypothetical protein